MPIPKAWEIIESTATLALSCNERLADNAAVPSEAKVEFVSCHKDLFVELLQVVLEFTAQHALAAVNNWIQKNSSYKICVQVELVELRTEYVDIEMAKSAEDAATSAIDVCRVQYEGREVRSCTAVRATQFGRVVWEPSE